MVHRLARVLEPLALALEALAKAIDVDAHRRPSAAAASRASAASSLTPSRTTTLSRDERAGRQLEVARVRDRESWRGGRGRHRSRGRPRAGRSRAPSRHRRGGRRSRDRFAPGTTRSRRLVRGAFTSRRISTLRFRLARDLPDPAVGDLADGGRVVHGVCASSSTHPRSPPRPLAERLERGSELGADPDDVLLEAALLGRGLARDAPRLGVRLLDDQVGLAPRLLLHVLRSALGRDERRAQERLELAVLRGLGLELLEAVGEVGALAPDLLEAVGDLLEQLVDRRGGSRAARRA